MNETITLTIVTDVGTALTGAIASLWKALNKQTAELKQRSEKCERKHEETQCQLLEVTREVGELKGRVATEERVTVKLDGLQKMISDAINSKGAEH